MSDWTFGDVKARNMEIVALCEQEGCRHLFTFDLDQIIEGAGADYKVADIPPMTCPACGAGLLAIRLSFAEPPPEGERLTLRVQEDARIVSAVCSPAIRSAHKCESRRLLALTIVR